MDYHCKHRFLVKKQHFHFFRNSLNYDLIKDRGARKPLVPELPEVEVTRNALSKFMSGKKISEVIFSEVWKAQLLRDGSKFASFASENSNELGTGGIVGREIETVSRVGKFYFIHLKQVKNQNPESWTIIEGHLRMTGGWWLLPMGGEWPKDFPDKHCHLHVLFDDGSKAVYRDVRRFGTLRLMTGEEYLERLQTMGPDPLAEEWEIGKMKDLLKGTKRNMKSVLLDQARISGLGNIYVCEVLHLASISPHRTADTIKTKESNNLFHEIAPLLRKAVEVGGTRLTNLDDLQYIHEPKLYLDNFEVHLQVYGREGEPCLKKGCGGLIERVVQQQRSTFYCASCQK